MAQATNGRTHIEWILLSNRNSLLHETIGKSVMSEEDDVTTAIRRLLAQVTALDEIVALLLADHIQKTADPLDSFRHLSNRLNRKFEDLNASDPIDARLLSEIQREIDRIIASARDIMG